MLDKHYREPGHTKAHFAFKILEQRVKTQEELWIHKALDQFGRDRVMNTRGTKEWRPPSSVLEEEENSGDHPIFLDDIYRPPSSVLEEEENFLYPILDDIYEPDNYSRRRGDNSDVDHLTDAMENAFVV
jgi:hypothetical protein